MADVKCRRTVVDQRCRPALLLPILLLFAGLFNLLLMDNYSDTQPSADSQQQQQQQQQHTTTSGKRLYIRPERISSWRTADAKHFRHRRDLLWDPHPSYALLVNDTQHALLTIHLQPVDDLINPWTTIHYIDSASNRTWIDQQSLGLGHCFYQGFVEGDPNSKVGLSLCHGMMGHIRTSRGSYFIEPAGIQGNSPDFPDIHLMYSLAQEFPADKDLQPSPREKPSANFPGSNADQFRGGPRKREKRSSSEEQVVEILVVADRKMAAYHGDNTVHYILTLMSVVSMIYKDASIGNPVHIAIADLKIVRDEAFATRGENDDKDKGISASEMLRRFCQWQKDFSDSTRNRYDTALLITRDNICRNPVLQKCDTLGLAELGTMCDKSSSCSIVQDNGLSAAFTIAHELGHVLNMPHDDDFKCQKFMENTQVQNVMSRMLDHNTYPWAWSNCSRYYLTEYLDAGYGDCLRNKPAKDLLQDQRQSKRLPGEDFDEHKQCELVFGNGSRICPYMPSCKRLWCTTSGGEQEGCRTQHMPWADGTPCGRNRWCRQGYCVPRDNRHPVDGNWGSWQEWGVCSRTCGGGVQRSIRNCDNPVPQNGGTYCVGMRVRYRSCHTHECPPGSRDFREEQCSVFNSNNFNIQGLPADVKWVPKYTGINPKDRCRLYCRVEQSSAYYLLKDKVIDGTTCGPDTDDICVNGICRPASCNHVLDRTEQLDMCGVCAGNNSTCVVMKGIYNQSQYGYNTVIRIPSGSSNMDIRQHGFMGSNRDDNYLALADAETGEYLLNGNFIVSMFQKTIQFGGTTIEYSGSDAVVERLNSSKPIKRDLLVQVLSVGSLYPPDITYQYVVSRDKGPTYQWRMHDQWSTCNRICNGTQSRKLFCVLMPGQQKVPEHNCPAATKPQLEVQSCNTHCTLRWRIIQKSECSAHCGKGYRNITKQCEKEDPNQPSIPLDAKHCRHLPEVAPDTEDCIGPCDTAHWAFDTWSPCSRTCGGGIQLRKAHCVDDYGRALKESDCRPEEKVTELPCSLQSCPQWKVGDWTPCSVSCGEGKRQRPYWCQQDNRVVARFYCPADPPVYEETCYAGHCPQWHAHDWPKCPVQCGVGKLYRTVECRSFNGTVLDPALCPTRERPSSSEECHMPPCTTTPPTTTTTAITTTTTTKGTVVPLKPAALAGFQPPPMEVGPSTESDPVGQQLGKDIDPTLNDIDSKPAKQEMQPIKGFWRTGDWSECSVTCGGGVRARNVVCYDIVSSIEVASQYCNETQPEAIEPCAMETCASWKTEEWSECSVTCGQGISRREVVCVHTSNYTSAPPQHCSTLSKPAGERPCYQVACNPVSHTADVEHNPTSKIQWRTGKWGPCSKTCGGGVKRRLVVCHDSNSTVSDQCLAKKRPIEIVQCNTDPCPAWSYGSWTPCSKSCGGGQQSRAVTCTDHLGQTVPDHRCHIHERPPQSQTCSPDPCNTAPAEKSYRWKSAKWTTCSKTCGKGLRHREVYCMEADEPKRRVPDEFCDSTTRPRSQRGCNKGLCPYMWITSPWSECSHTCGPGIQLRRVTCHRVNAFGWIDPEPVFVGCNSTEQPHDSQRCNQGECGASYYWKALPWQPCSASCGEPGMQKRSLACHSQSGARVSRLYCPKEFRPIRKQPCQAKPCGIQTCLEAKTLHKTNRDGEYTILVGGRNISIFCHSMNSSMPREYVTLPSGESGNYAEIYDKTLISPDTCPYRGNRNDSCDCRSVKHQVGLTQFSKIRVNVTSLRVLNHDFTFARVRGARVGYGEAGDCYSTANCPQGRFSINLEGTKLRVAPHTIWVGHGERTSLRIDILEENQKVQGKCGGYCGRCSPDPHSGLKLDLAPNRS